MTDKPLQKGTPGVVHLGTSRVGHKGAGAYVTGVFKLRGDPGEDLLSLATNFLKAADRCLNGNKCEPGIDMLVEPGAVCASLSCELFLKYLVFRETGKMHRSHHLDFLFSLCSPETQADLSKHVFNAAEVFPRNANAFVGSRYHHEQEQFSFRQGELLLVAESLAEVVRARFTNASPDTPLAPPRQ